MYELSGKIQGLTIDFFTKKAMLTLSINEEDAVKNLYDELHDCVRLKIKIDKWRNKRSLNANNYCWYLLTEMGNVLRTSKDDLYLEMLKRYGQSEIISVLSHIPIREYVKYCEEAGESTLNGKLFKHYKVYKGSSEFDTREMSIFLDGIVSEAKDLGIQTGTER
ncbi:MAG: hypothetical protein IJE92_02040, partial [Clostridia bacterium]|nr:hypothetical protein [Clostridia bacterium]